MVAKKKKAIEILGCVHTSSVEGGNGSEHTRELVLRKGDTDNTEATWGGGQDVDGRSVSAEQQTWRGA